MVHTKQIPYGNALQSRGRQFNVSPDGVNRRKEKIKNAHKTSGSWNMEDIKLDAKKTANHELNQRGHNEDA
jgi:hypothetical protein